MARLLADENFSRPVVLLLRVAGHDVVTVQELNKDRSPDPDVLALATADGRAVLTGDNDYFRLHRLQPDHAGIVLPTDDRDVAALAARIHSEIIKAGDLIGRLVRITKPHRATP